MVSEDKSSGALTPLQEKVLLQYQKYLGKYRVREKNARSTIRKGLLDWLAQPVRREMFRLEDLPVHEQAAVIDHVIDHLQGKRTVKAVKTRKQTAKRLKASALKARQQSFDF